MSKFRILRIDHFDPVSVGKKTRFLYAVYGIIPTLFILSVNLGHYGTMNYSLMLIISVPVLLLIYYFLLKRLRAATDNLKTIGELEITQSGFRKRIGDSVSEYSFQMIREVRLVRHIPATRVRDSKSGFFSYIIKFVFNDGHEESVVVSDRSVDHDHKISISDTMKTLKKIVPFEVIIEN
jgi:hypothetical protein